MPDGEIPYSTAFDIALSEVEAKRLRPEQALRVGNTILQKNRPDLIFPDFVRVCPTDSTYSLGPIAAENPELVVLSKKIGDYVQAYCMQRPET